MTTKNFEICYLKLCTLFRSYYFSKQLNCIPWTKTFEKTFQARESKYYKSFLNIYLDN